MKLFLVSENGVKLCPIIIIVIFKCYFSREHIGLSYKKSVDIELGKTSRLKALCMMENHTLNKQAMCQQTVQLKEKCG